MPLTLSLAQPGDEKRIAQIHMAAFGPNAMHRAMFPTSAAEKGLEKILEKITAWEIGDPGTTILIVSEVRDRGEDGTEMKGDGDEKKIVAYAQWTHPERAVEGDEEGMGGEKDGGEGRDGGEEKEKLTYAKGTAHEVISAWRSKMAEAQRRVIGGRPCYCLHFIGTDPTYERRGAATLMLQWGVQRCKEERVPAYLESTIEAVPLYEKNGFVEKGRFGMDIRPHSEEWGEGEWARYEEVCFLYAPNNIMGDIEG